MVDKQGNPKKRYLAKGSLINYFGLCHIKTRSREAAAKVMYMTAMAYNLKKYLRFTPVEQSGMVIVKPTHFLALTHLVLLNIGKVPVAATSPTWPFHTSAV